MTREYAMQILREMIPKFARCDKDVKILTAINMAIKALSEERKTGRWKFVSYGDGLGNYHCSECRAIASSYFVGNLVNRHWEYKLTKYCPKCGAKMERSRGK